MLSMADMKTTSSSFDAIILVTMLEETSRSCSIERKKLLVHGALPPGGGITLKSYKLLSRLHLLNSDGNLNKTYGTKIRGKAATATFLNINLYGLELLHQ